MDKYTLRSNITKVVDAFCDMGAEKVLGEAITMLVDNAQEKRSDVSLTFAGSRGVISTIPGALHQSSL